MWRTRVGYAGGASPDPTYRRIADHTECFQVDFDPETITYGELLDLFWQSHDPTRPAYSSQYASLVLAADRAQLAEARASADRIEALLGRKVLTRIETLNAFYLAEGYHQKYRLRNTAPLMNEFVAMYPADGDFIDSTASAKVNGYLDGSGTPMMLDREIDKLGLSATARTRLEQTVAGRRFW